MVILLLVLLLFLWLWLLYGFIYLKSFIMFAFILFRIFFFFFHFDFEDENKHKNQGCNTEVRETTTHHKNEGITHSASHKQYILVFATHTVVSHYGNKLKRIRVGRRHYYKWRAQTVRIEKKWEKNFFFLFYFIIMATLKRKIYPVIITKYTHTHTYSYIHLL